MVSWDAPPTEHQNGEVRQYIVNITEDNTGLMWQEGSETRELKLNSLHPYYNYSCQVAAVTVSMGPFGETITVTTLQDRKLYY